MQDVYFEIVGHPQPAAKRYRSLAADLDTQSGLDLPVGTTLLFSRRTRQQDTLYLSCRFLQVNPDPARIEELRAGLERTLRAHKYGGPRLSLRFISIEKAV